MAFCSDTRWGREFDGVDADDRPSEAWSDAAASLTAGQWDDALQSLARGHAQDPARSVEAMELASCVHLARDEDLRGAVARARFSVGHVTDRTPWDALATVVSERLQEQDDGSWAALALLDHSQGVPRLAEQVREGTLEERWLTHEGLDALEALVFARADETQDPGWVALSATLAARDSTGASDEQLILRASRRHTDGNARAWGVELLVLFSLDRDDAAQGVMDLALDRFENQPRALREILDTTNMDEELQPLLHALGRHRPEWIAEREVATQAAQTSLEGHNAQGLVHALASALDVSPARLTGGLLLPDGPRRTDDEWMERKAGGDKAFGAWLHTFVGVGAALVSLVWILFRILG